MTPRQRGKLKATCGQELATQLESLLRSTNSRRHHTPTLRRNKVTLIELNGVKISFHTGSIMGVLTGITLTHTNLNLIMGSMICAGSTNCLEKRLLETAKMLNSVQHFAKKLP